MFGAAPNGDLIVGGCVFVLIVFASWLSCQLFAGRAAFLLVGAMIATTMSGNVFFWIIPGQRKVVAAMRAGQPVDPVHGQRGKQRSVHNTYFTLPVLFAMMSNHYGFTYGAKYNWLVLVAIMLAGALIRHVVRAAPQGARRGQPVPWRCAVMRTSCWPARSSRLLPAPQPRRPGGAGRSLRRGAGGRRAALRAVPRRGDAEQERALRFARRDRAACAGGLPAGRGAQAHADEQRHPDHRRRARA